MKSYSNIPNFVVMAVFSIESVAIGSWWYLFTKSILEKTFLHAGVQ
jgi:hypothetical protein